MWLTIEAKCHTGEDDVYADWSVAKPIVGWSLMEIGKAATGGAAETGLSSAGWYCGEDRTVYKCGGPPVSSVKGVSGGLQHLVLTSPDVTALYITEECPGDFHVTKYIE